MREKILETDAILKKIFELRNEQQKGWKLIFKIGMHRFIVGILRNVILGKRLFTN